MHYTNCAIDDTLGEYREPTYKLAAYKDDGWSRKEVGIEDGLQPEGIASHCRKVCKKGSRITSRRMRQKGSI